MIQATWKIILSLFAMCNENKSLKNWGTSISIRNCNINIGTVRFLCHYVLLFQLHDINCNFIEKASPAEDKKQLIILGKAAWTSAVLQCFDCLSHFSVKESRRPGRSRLAQQHIVHAWKAGTAAAVQAEDIPSGHTH